MRITDMITQDEFAWNFINFSPGTTSVGNKYRLGKQMRIQILILGFKGLAWTFL